MVANTLKYLDSQPLIGVNPDNRRWDGFLLPFNSTDIEKVVIDVFRNNRQITLRQQDDFKWNSDFLYFSVREPYPSNWTSANLVFGRVDATFYLKIVSQMPENGVIFSDGIENDFLEFNSGVGATIKIADKKGILVV